jgi:2-methylisocitrate lyase-like PEP mutase family enzyme
MPITQHDKALRFQSLHAGPETFVIPNPWDAGSAKCLAGLGFPALATSSGAAARSRGKRDLNLGREETLTNAKEIVEAVDLPVSADLGNGFGDAPDLVAETILAAAEAGLVGCTIEDASNNPNAPLYDFNLAVDRIAAAAAAASKLPSPFALTARAHHLLYHPESLDETIRRLKAFEEAGADVLFAPGLPSLAAVREVCQAVSKPVNFMVGIKGKSFSMPELTEAGVRRISLAASLHQVAMAAFLEAATEVKDEGSFTYLERTISTPTLYDLMGI